MKKKLLFFWMLLALTSVQAQNFKPFKLGVGVGYTQPAEGGGGVLISLEPAYRINDAIAVGLKIESAAMAKTIGYVDAEIAAIGSYSINGQYYFGQGSFRPYVGLGLGLYSMGNVSVSEVASSGDAEVSVGDKFGFYPRIGFDFGHFNFNIDYNIVPKSSIESISFDDLSNGLQTEKIDVKNSYIGFRIGFFLFGGKNKE